MSKLEQIQARMSEIKQEIDTREKGGAVLTADEVKAYETEVDSLEIEKREIIETKEKRDKLLGKIASGDSIPVESHSFSGMPQVGSATEKDDIDPDDPYGSISYRKAFQAFVTTGAEIPAELRATSNETTKTGDAGIMILTTVLNRIVEGLTSAGNILKGS